jgi:hypothetical protein
VPGQTIGRFDLNDRPPVRYLAESPQHAIGEALAAFRGTKFRSSYLQLAGHPLAIVEVTLSANLVQRIADCADPAVMVAHGVRPDELADHDRTKTQAIARRFHMHEQLAGLRWWSALTGAWHTNVLFTDRLKAGDVVFHPPRVLQASDADVVQALAQLGISAR